MSYPLAVAHRSVGKPVRQTQHLARILFPYAVRAVPSAPLGVHEDSSPRCHNTPGADASANEAGTTENVGLIS